MAAKSFREQLEAFKQKTEKKIDAVTRNIVFRVGTKLVEYSPVGNPSLWKDWNPKGSVRENSEHWLVKANFVGEGYVGGRFRANWQFGDGSIDRTTTEEIDPDGNLLLAKLSARLAPGKPGRVFYLTNSLPYGPRLEDGYSTQAPNGFKRRTVLEFQPIVSAAARELAK